MQYRFDKYSSVHFKMTTSLDILWTIMCCRVMTLAEWPLPPRSWKEWSTRTHMTAPLKVIGFSALCTGVREEGGSRAEEREREREWERERERKRWRDRKKHQKQRSSGLSLTTTMYITRTLYITMIFFVHHVHVHYLALYELKLPYIIRVQKFSHQY